MKQATIVYDIKDEAEWARVNPLYRLANGATAVRIAAGDGLEARDALRELMPFVEQDYEPECFTPEYAAAVERARRAAR